MTKKGKGTKWMLVVEGQGLPVGALLDSAQRAEVTLAEPTLAQVRIPRRGRGRPRTRPRELVADRGYDSDALRTRLRRRGIRPCIPGRRNRKPRRGRKTNLTAYRDRWHVERTFAWLGNCRRLVVRYERLLTVYHAFFALACIMILVKRLLQ